MEPKFQSSFIPKSPVIPNAATSPITRKVEGKSLVTFLAIVIFIISVVLAIGVFGYKFYLKYRIDQMGTALSQAQTTIDPDTIRELTRLDNRIISTKNLVDKHTALTPLFEFLEASTPKTVRFSEFRYVKD